MWAVENPIKMNYKLKLKGRASWKIKKEDIQAVLRCHIKSSKED